MRARTGPRVIAATAVCTTLLLGTLSVGAMSHAADGSADTACSDCVILAPAAHDVTSEPSDKVL